MSGSLSKEERRNIRRTLGETAAAAMAEAKEEVQRCRGELMHTSEMVRALDMRTKQHEERIKAALKLGFDNEATAKRHTALLSVDDTFYSMEHVKIRLNDHFEDIKRFRAVLERPTFFGRLQWLFLGR